MSKSKKQVVEDAWDSYGLPALRLARSIHYQFDNPEGTDLIPIRSNWSSSKFYYARGRMRKIIFSFVDSLYLTTKKKKFSKDSLNYPTLMYFVSRVLVDSFRWQLLYGAGNAYRDVLLRDEYLSLNWKDVAYFFMTYNKYKEVNAGLFIDMAYGKDFGLARDYLEELRKGSLLGSYFDCGALIPAMAYGRDIHRDDIAKSISNYESLIFSQVFKFSDDPVLIEILEENGARVKRSDTTGLYHAVYGLHDTPVIDTSEDRYLRASSVLRHFNYDKF